MVQEPTVKDLTTRNKESYKPRQTGIKQKWINIYSFESILLANVHCNRCRWMPRISSCRPLVREESAGTSAWRQWSRSPADLRIKPAGNSTALFPLHTSSLIFYAMLKQTACLLPASPQKTKNFSGTFYCKDSIRPFSVVTKCMLKWDHLPGSCIILCPHV